MSASAFQGYLLKGIDGTILDKYINWEGYTDTPDQRQDKDSYRDGYGELQRQVLPTVATTLKITLLDGLSLYDLCDFMESVNSGLVNAAERATRLTYWNNERMNYCTDTFYIPDTSFPVKYIDNDGVPRYKSVNLEFIGYGERR